jgi:hypothetical protein
MVCQLPASLHTASSPRLAPNERTHQAKAISLCIVFQVLCEVALGVVWANKRRGTNLTLSNIKGDAQEWSDVRMGQTAPYFGFPNQPLRDSGLIVCLEPSSRENCAHHFGPSHNAYPECTFE